MVDHQTETMATEQLAFLASVYRLLGQLWRRELDLPMLRQLCHPPLREEWESVGGEVPAEDAEALESLAIDFCQLFLGPKGHLPPFQSVWESGQFCGSASAAMKNYVDLSGYQATDVDAGMLDHLGIQFDVMAHIVEQLSRAPDQRQAFEGLTAAFFEAHLSWPSSLLDGVEQQAQTPFYRSLAAVTRRFLAMEAPGSQPN